MITTVSLWKGFLKIHPKNVFCVCAFFFFFGWKIAWLRTVDLLPNSLGKQIITIRVGVLCAEFGETQGGLIMVCLMSLRKEDMKVMECKLKGSRCLKLPSSEN